MAGFPGFWGDVDQRHSKAHTNLRQKAAKRYLLPE